MDAAEIQQLLEMGATPAQAKAALSRYNDVMQAAEMIFSGAFDDADNAGGSGSRRATTTVRPITPEDEEDRAGSDDDAMDDGDEDEDEDEAGYNDYDSDYDMKASARKNGAAVDPYAGIFFSKTRREEVVEVEEEPEYTVVEGVKCPIMSQSEFMKGCPEAQEQTFLFSLYNKLSERGRKCPQCSNVIPITKAQFFTVHPSFAGYTQALRDTVVQKCRSCSQELCIACGEGISTSDKKRASHQPPYDPLFHCSDLQGIILGIGLYMIDVAYTDDPTNAKDRDGERSAKKRKVDTTESLIGSGKKKSGTGYDGAPKEDTSGQAEAHANQTARDHRIGHLMKEVRVYLPSLQREGGSQTTDYLVSPTALAHLRRRFNTVASSLLRNDSLTDMSDRSVLYFELFQWLQTISNHEALASMVAMPIMIPSSFTTTTSPIPGQKRLRERKVVYEGSSGPRELMESLVIQATAAKKGLQGDKPEPVPGEDEEMTEEQKRVTAGNGTAKGKEKAKNPFAEENLKLLSFCDRILATAGKIDRSLRDTKGEAFLERIYASLPKIPSKARPNNADASSSRLDTSEPQAPLLAADVSEEDAQRTYEEWAMATRFEYCDLSIPPTAAALEARQRRAEETGAPQDDAPMYMSVYSQEARMLANSDIPKRSLAIAKELAVLTTNLPVAWNSSIFLRVDETRVDVIKALITGPEDTPYYNGCYVFDIFLGPTYNTSPPSVKYMTTNNGRFRFNPNLYADGKVCLSLLGTWSGPGWVAGKSTLLQVLISIQSMILCDEPYLNEPGWANGTGTSASLAYSANVRRMVVHTAMLGNLKNPPEPFKDIILTHFRLKAQSITKQLDDWLKQDDGKALSGQGAGYTTVNAGTGNQSAGPAGSGFRRDVDEVKKLLAALARGDDISHLAGPSTSAMPTPLGTAAPSETNLLLDDFE